ncbi:ribonuclease P protein component [Patescibacteria group bacterium]|nr:ribonuclease P protein component [Patescibacteria group bacterium]MBU2158594.1 ribonuclease P protein component [Patescibacteria group bacterium]
MRLSRAHFAPSGPEKRLASPHFSLSVRESSSQGGCAAVVSKKVAKLAVSRHRLKRRILVSARPWCSSSCAVVVYARPGAAELSFEELHAELSSLLTRALGQVR